MPGRVNRQGGYHEEDYRSRSSNRSSFPVCRNVCCKCSEVRSRCKGQGDSRNRGVGLFEVAFESREVGAEPDSLPEDIFPSRRYQSLVRGKKGIFSKERHQHKPRKEKCGRQDGNLRKEGQRSNGRCQNHQSHNSIYRDWPCICQGKREEERGRRDTVSSPSSPMCRYRVLSRILPKSLGPLVRSSQSSLRGDCLYKEKEGTASKQKRTMGHVASERR